MTQVSKYPITKDVEGRMFEILFKVIGDLNGSSEIKDFIDDFLTPVERIMLAKRLTIGVLLVKGYDYASIRKVLCVSPPTISRAATSLKYASGGYKKTIQKLLQEEKIEEFLHKVEDVILDQFPVGTDWSYWRKEREKKKLARRKAL